MPNTLWLFVTPTRASLTTFYPYYVCIFLIFFFVVFVTLVFIHYVSNSVILLMGSEGGWE